MSVRSEYLYEATFHRVYDGDGAFDATIHIDLGFYMYQDIPRKIRLMGVDTPEIKGEQKEAAVIVRDFVRSLILDKRLTIKTTYENGKFGRLLAEIYVPWMGRENIPLSEILLDMGYAKPYYGGHKEGWSRKELLHIIQTNRKDLS